MVLAAPIAVPAAILAVLILLPVFALAWPFMRYGRWLRAKGWHEWFAWRPVRFRGFFHGLPDQWLWLERVERRVTFAGTEYRPIGTPDD